MCVCVCVCGGGGGGGEGQCSRCPHAYGNINSLFTHSFLDLGDSYDECTYVVGRLKDLPKLHRTVWRGDLMKTKCICNGIRKSVLNARDKEHR